MKVKCNVENCKNFKNGYCTKDEIEMLKTRISDYYVAECLDYIEK